MRNYHEQIKPRKVPSYRQTTSAGRLNLALNAVGLLALADPDLFYPARHRNLLRIAIDDLADVGGKKNARFRSLEVWEAELSDTPIRLVHEHVVERQWLAEKILADPESYRETCLRWHATCWVTPDQDELLDRAARELVAGEKRPLGWARYKKAGVVVVDGLSGERVNLDAAWCQLDD